MQDDASDVAVTPDNSRIYVPGNFEVSLFNANIQQAGKIAIGKYAERIAFTPDGKRAFVAISCADAVSIIDTAQLKQIQVLKVGSKPISVAVTPDGKQLYVGNYGSNTVSVFDPFTLEPLSNSPISVGAGPLRLASSHNGRLMFVLCSIINCLYVIDNGTRTVIGWAQTGSSPLGLAVSPDGVRVFVLLGTRQMWLFLPAATEGIG